MPDIVQFGQGAQSNRLDAALLHDLAGVGLRIIGEKSHPVSAKDPGFLMQVQAKTKSPHEKRAPNLVAGAGFEPTTFGL
jgi:hypothetical protein